MNTEKDTSTFKARFKLLLEHEQVDFSQFAENIGRSTDTIRAYAKGGSMPKVDALLAIKKKYPAWSLRFLLTGEGKPIIASVNSTIHHYQTHKKSVLKWLALRDRIRYDLEVLPLDGFQFVFEDAIKELEKLNQENEEMLVALEQMAQKTILPY